MKFKTSIPEELKKNKPKAISINFKRIGLMITQPRKTFQDIEGENHKADWKSPVIVVAVIIILASLLSVTSSTNSTTSQAQTSSSNGTSSFGFSNMSPGGMQGGSPMGMGGQMQSDAASSNDADSTEDLDTSTASSSSTLLSKVLSAVGSLLGFLLTWLLVGSLSNLVAISFGGQGNPGLASVFAAWTCLPIGVRSFLQIMYYFATGNTIKAVGLSGFAPTTSSNMAILLEKFLAQIDIYTIWEAILLFIGVGVMTKLDKKKSIFITAISMVVVILIKTFLGLGLEKIASINISSNLLGTMMR